MFAGTRRTPKSGSTATSNPHSLSKSATKPLKNAGMSLSSSAARSQSQEDLTKSRPTRSKYNGGSSTTNGSSTRRTVAAKDSAKSTDKPREKTKTTSAKSSSSSASSSGRSTSTISRRTKDATGSKGKTEVDKVALEGKIKDLMGMAKAKDSEISSLKSKLDQMMLLLKKQQQQQDEEDFSSVSCSSPKPSSASFLPAPSFTSLVKLSDAREERLDEASSSINDVQTELLHLQDENAKLRDQMDAMMISMKHKDSNKSLMLNRRQRLGHADLDTLSNDDGLSSSLDDLASATSGDALQSTSVSRSTSTENLLEDASFAFQHSASRSDDKTSDCALSESSSVTVACLTERIHRMEESHISTNEELEATVQELTDLQKSVPELTIDNDRLQKEKDFLMVKLQLAEKKLSEQAAEAEHLRALVSDHLGDDANHSDLKQQYVHLLNEREQLIQIQESMSKELRGSEEERKKSQDLQDAFKERLRHLERELSQSNTEKSLLEKKVKETKATMEEEHSDVVQRLEEELRKERQRVTTITDTLQAPGVDAGKSMMELVDSLQGEKQELEDRLLLLEDDFNQCQNENEKLDARVAELEEDLEATRARANNDLSELSELIDRLQEDLKIKQASLDEVNDTLFVMEDSVEQHIAVKKHDNHIIGQLNNQISNLKEERFRLEKEIQQLKKEQRNQSEEWKQFQADLQMAVMIANDMKAEVQSEVAKLREDNQALDEAVTKLQVENEQLRRRRVSSVSANSSAILEAAALRQQRSTIENNIAAIRETYKRRTGETSPGVQSLIKSFDNQSSVPGEAPSSPTRAQTPMAPAPASALPPPTDLPSPGFSPAKGAPQGGKVPPRAGSSPITATVSPMQRHHSMSSITTAMSQGGTPPSASFANKLVPSSNGDSAASSKPGTPDSSRGNGTVPSTDLSQLSTLLRRNSTQEFARKTSTDGRKPQLNEIYDRLGPSTPVSRHPKSTAVPPSTPSTPANTKHRGHLNQTPSTDPLATLARRYGGSKRNALLKWCQEKTQSYKGIDITNFSSSWSDGLAFCALLHSYLPAHIPYDSLLHTFHNAPDDKARFQLQAKHFRLAFAAAESVGIEPTLAAEEMSNKDRPDWQRVMNYVTMIYKYFET